MGSDILHHGKYILWTNRLWCPEFLWKQLINYGGHVRVETFYKVGELKLWVASRVGRQMCLGSQNNKRTWLFKQSSKYALLIFVSQGQCDCRELKFSQRYWYRGADKSLARPRRKQARKHVREARFQQHRDASCHQDFFFFLQGKAQKEIHAILTETLACFLPGRAKDLSQPLYWPAFSWRYSGQSQISA